MVNWKRDTDLLITTLICSYPIASLIIYCFLRPWIIDQYLSIKEHIPFLKAYYGMDESNKNVKEQLNIIMKSVQTNATKWNEHHNHKIDLIRPKILNIGNSIWSSTSCYDDIIQGMVEYDIKSNMIINIVKYNQNCIPKMHSVCKHKNNIYILDGGINGRIITFNTSTKQFIKIKKIPKIGIGSAGIAIGDNIHIFNGRDNCKHLIYSIKNNGITKLNDDISTKNIANICVLKFKDRIIRFGGYNHNTLTAIDTFYISSPIKRNQRNNIKWILKPQYKLIIPLHFCGYVIYKHYILTFGGEPENGTFIDTIYVLDLNKNTGWKEIKHIKCPLPSQYIAVLTANNDIHLFSKVNLYPHIHMSIKKHYSIPISTILSNIDGKNKQNKLYSNKNQITSTQQRINGVKDNNIVLSEELRMKEKENSKVGEEYKETELELNQIKTELNELKIRKDIDTINFLQWTSDEFVDWIITLESGKFLKYEKTLRLIFNKEDVCGKAIPFIEKTEWKEWGITNFLDRVKLNQYVRELMNGNIEQQHNIEYEEGDTGTAYI